MQSVFRQLPGTEAKLPGTEAEEDVVTKVRSESSVSSVSSYVRVSVGDLASLQSGTPSLPLHYGNVWRQTRIFNKGTMDSAF